MQAQVRSGPASCQRHAISGLAMATRVQVRPGARTRDDQGPEKSWGIANKRQVVDQPVSNQPPQQFLGIPAKVTKGGASCRSCKEPITKIQELRSTAPRPVWRLAYLALSGRQKETARDFFWDSLTGTQAPTKTSPPKFQLLPVWSSAPSIISHPSLTLSVSLLTPSDHLLFSSHSLPAESGNHTTDTGCLRPLSILLVTTEPTAAAAAAAAAAAFVFTSHAHNGFSRSRSACRRAFC